jgi:ribosomal-protein-serine acetyltransferase
VTHLDYPPSGILRPLTADDAPDLLNALNADRGTFDRWLRWSAEIRDMESAKGFILSAAERQARNSGFHLGIVLAGSLAGGVVCWSIDATHQVAELGYWLARDARNRGHALCATAIVVDYLFSQQRINRVEFQCMVENAASRQVAARLGASFEGIRRQSHRIGGEYKDHAVYSLLADEWRQSSRATGDPWP